MAKNFTWSWCEEFFLVCHTSAAPSAEEWNDWIGGIERHGRQARGILVYTGGGSPSAVQRKQMRDALLSGKAPPPTAVLMGSLIVRTTITALNIFWGNKMKGFAPSAVEEGMEYISVPRDKWATLRQRLDEMKRGLDIKT